MSDMASRSSAAGAPTELLPCPFCGDTGPRAYSTGGWWCIRCTHHKCHGAAYSYADTEAEAIAAWNTRVVPVPSSAAGAGIDIGYTLLRFGTLLDELLVWGGHNDECWHQRKHNAGSACFCGWDAYAKKMAAAREELNASLSTLLARQRTNEPEAWATNYALAHDLMQVAEWIAAHAFRSEESRAPIDTLTRAVSHLRGVGREPVARLDELLRNDPWAAAIAAHVRQSDVARQREGEHSPFPLRDLPRWTPLYIDGEISFSLTSDGEYVMYEDVECLASPSPSFPSPGPGVADVIAVYEQAHASSPSSPSAAPEPTDTSTPMTGCNCKYSDAWRCAVKRGSSSGWCHCACHRSQVAAPEPAKETNGE